MKENYWDTFYVSKVNEIPGDPSPFAKLIADKLDSNDRVLELGCGNGRDSVYLKKYCKSLLGIDSSKKTLEKLKTLEDNTLKFINLDIKDIDKLDYEPTIIYSRFFLHSIDEESEDKLFTWLANASNGTRFICECRSEKDMELFKFYGNTHYRRGIKLDKLVKKLTDLNFTIEESIESRGLSIYKEEDPFIIRIIARK